MVFPAGLCVVVLGEVPGDVATDGEGSAGLLHRSPWQHVIPQLVISALIASVAFFTTFFMTAHVKFLLISPYFFFEEHVRKWTTTSRPIIGTLPVIVTVTQESCLGALHSMVILGLPHKVPKPSKTLMLPKFGKHR